MSVNRNIFSDTRRSKLIVIEALVVTCLFHLALLMALVYEPTPAEEVSGSQHKITLMNLTNPAAGNAARIMNWLEYHDPSLLIRADHPHSYAEMTRRSVSREARPDPPRPSVIDELAKPEIVGFEPLAAPRPSERRPTPFLGYAATPPPPRETTPLQIDYPRLLRGETALDVAVPETLTAQADETGSLSVFRVRLTRFDPALFPRYEVLSSSGDAAFDREIMNFIIARSNEMLADDVFAEISIIWNDGGQE